MTNAVALPPAGWYQHPQIPEPGHEMLWDGQSWRTDLVKHPGVPNLYAPSGPTQHVIVHQDRGRKVNHVLHAILTIVTVGLWLPVWLIVAIAKN